MSEDKVWSYLTLLAGWVRAVRQTHSAEVTARAQCAMKCGL